MKQVVVAAVIVSADGRILAAQRAAPPELAGGWEFPGGKVEPGEGEAEALVRECREELGVEVAVGRRIGGDWPLGAAYVMRVYLASLVAGEPRPKEHQALRWLTPGEYGEVAWLAADLPVAAAVADLLQEG